MFVRRFGVWRNSGNGGFGGVAVGSLTLMQDICGRCARAHIAWQSCCGELYLGACGHATSRGRQQFCRDQFDRMGEYADRLQIVGQHDSLMGRVVQ